MFRHIFLIILFLVILIPTTSTTIAFAQQASMVWDDASKSWISAPAATPTITTTPTPQTQQQQQFIPQQQQQTPQPQTIIQPQPVTAGQSTVDLGTLATVITPILAGIAGMFVKNRKDMEKKDEETKTK